MKNNLKSTHFKYGFFPAKSKELLDKLSKESPATFEKIINVGLKIEKFAKDEDLTALSMLIEENTKNLNYLSYFVKEAYLSALNFKYFEVVGYFLENGLNLKDENFKDSLLTLCRISKFTPNDLPIELMDLLLLHGADPNFCDPEKYKTPLHVASKNGMLEFVVALVMNGKAEVNPVDINKKTPLKYVSEKLKKGKRFEEVYKFLESQGGVEDWRV